jgi:hypothetical protein
MLGCHDGIPVLDLKGKLVNYNKFARMVSGMSIMKNCE